jgi:hypothetical protein
MLPLMVGLPMKPFDKTQRLWVVGKIGPDLEGLAKDAAHEIFAFTDQLYQPLRRIPGEPIPRESLYHRVRNAWWRTIEQRVRQLRSGKRDHEGWGDSRPY